MAAALVPLFWPNDIYFMLVIMIRTKYSSYKLLLSKNRDSYLFIYLFKIHELLQLK